MKTRAIPEVIQTSSMDCGPAALASLLNGFGMSVSYPRLRELCQTDVDGTSIDTLEVLAARFGLDAEQVMLPNDFLFRRSNRNLPAIVVVTLPNGLTHFVVAWRERFGYVQIMDPARGRSWMRKDRLLRSLYQHRISVEAEDWNEYARTEEFTATLAEALQLLGVPASYAQELLTNARADASWQSLARLDAAVRMCRSLRDAGEKIRSGNVLALLEVLLDEQDVIPDNYYQVRPDPADADELILTGAVVLSIRANAQTDAKPDPLLAATRDAAQPSVSQRLLGLLAEIGMSRITTALVGVSVLIGFITFIEALVFRYLIGAQPPTDLLLLALIAVVVIAPLAAAVTLEAGGIRMSQAIGRQLDTRLRTLLLRKLPRIADGYFSSRLISDLAERGHAVTQVREFPDLLRRTVIAATRIGLLLAGLTWLLPQEIGLILVATLTALIAPFTIYPALAERDMRARTHVGALSRFYLDSLRGTEAIWAHGAARSMQDEHESLLTKWAQAVK
jgi:ABC-type bacteriocin/lantibiotic exporter with double-glycine peptidase domain